MSYALPLRKVLHERDLPLCNRLEEIENVAKSVLTYVHGKFPYYTPHDFQNHTLTVEDNLNWLMPDSVKQSLNAHELFFLLTAAYT